jgi:type I restriction enzyme S subunit
MNTQTQHTTKYKNSPLGLIPEEWEVKHFEDVSDIDKNSLKGNTPKGYEFDYVSLSDVNSDEFKIETTKQIFESAPSRARRIVKKGDILMSTVRPNLQGFSLIKDEVKDLIASTGFAVITSNKCSNEFLFHFLFSDLIIKQFHQLLVGSNYPAINSSDVRKLKLTFPSLPEQTAIANCLSTWDNAIEKHTALIAQKELSKKALMQQLLSGKKRLKGFSGEWKEFSLGGISDYVKGFAFSSESYKNEGVRIIRISDTTSDSIKNEGGIYVDEIEAYKFKKWELKEHDLVFTTVGSRPPLYDSMVGKVIKIEKKFEGSLLNQNAVIIRGKEIVNQVFLYNQFKNRRYLEFVESIVRGNANQVSVTLENLFSYKIKLPSIEEQVAIANLLQCADTEIQLLKTKLIQLKEQKKGLMQVLLTGKKRLKY